MYRGATTHPTVLLCVVFHANTTSFFFVRLVFCLPPMPLAIAFKPAGTPQIRSHRVRSNRCAAAASDRVTLGSSELSVSKCCLGTMTWGQQNTEVGIELDRRALAHRTPRLTSHSSLLTPHFSFLTPHSSLLTSHSRCALRSFARPRPTSSSTTRSSRVSISSTRLRFTRSHPSRRPRVARTSTSGRGLRRGAPGTTSSWPPKSPATVGSRTSARTDPILA